MKLIEDLGKEVVGYDLQGRPQHRRFGIYACTVCGIGIKLTTTRSRVQKFCKNCHGITHGMSKTRQYRIWQGMISRCKNPNNKKYHIYGGKGITVCEKWDTFEGFWEDNESRYQNDLTIDRIDSNKGYTLENTRWISHSQNSSETAKRRPVTQFIKDPLCKGNLIFIKEWESAKQAADELGIVAAHITAVCQGNRKTHQGSVWKYTEDVKSI